MELYLCATILHDVYSYMSLFDLRHMYNVPTDIWHSWYDYLYHHPACGRKLHIYWGESLSTGIIPYKVIVMNFMMWLVKHEGKSYDGSLWNNRDFIIERLKINEYVELNEEFKKDKEIMKLEIKTRPWNYKDHPLMQDVNFVRKIVNDNPYAIIFVHPDLRTEKELLHIAAIKLGITPISDVSKLYLWIVMKGIRNDGFYQYYLSPELRSRREIRSLLDDQRMHYLNRRQTKKAIQNGVPFYKIKREYMDKDMAIFAAEYGTVDATGSILQSVGWDLFCDRDVVLACVKKEGTNLAYALEFTNDPEVVWEAVKSNGTALAFADSIFRQDQAFMLKVLSLDSSLFGFAHKSLKTDCDFLRKFIRLK